MFPPYYLICGNGNKPQLHFEKRGMLFKRVEPLLFHTKKINIIGIGKPIIK
jgi:hypothetical protein